MVLNIFVFSGFIFAVLYLYFCNLGGGRVFRWVNGTKFDRKKEKRKENNGNSQIRKIKNKEKTIFFR